MNDITKPNTIRACLIVNPFARNGHRLADLEQAERLLREHGWDLTRVHVDRPDEVRDKTQEAVEDGHNLIVVVGGDGSIGQATDVLSGTEVALGIIPAGTGNILARDLGLPIPAPWYPHAFVDAARQLVTATWWRVDVGHARCKEQCRRFLNWCGAGLDAWVTLRVEPHPEEKRRWGVAAYVMPAIQELLHYRPVPWRVVVDDVTEEGTYYLVVTHNSQLYAGIFRLAPQARMDDGRLDVALVAAHTPQELVTALSRATLGGAPPSELIRLYRAQRVWVEAYPAQPVHLDGDPLMRTPVEIHVEPHALTLLVPSGDRFPHHLLGEPDHTQTAARTGEELWQPW